LHPTSPFNILLCGRRKNRKINAAVEPDFFVQRITQHCQNLYDGKIRTVDQVVVNLPFFVDFLGNGGFLCRL
jgi:hypothetical protein